MAITAIFYNGSKNIFKKILLNFDVRHIMRDFLLKFMLCFLLAGLSAVNFAHAQKIDEYQRDFLEKQLNLGFNRMIAAWEEEKFYGELYLLGTAKSKELLSATDFSERMNRNLWTIDSAKIEIKDISILEITYAILAKIEIKDISILEITYAILEVDITMYKKLKKIETVKISTIFETIYEKHDDNWLWRFNIIKLLAFPYKI